MDQEIDLRDYIAVLLKYKFWIVALAIVFAVIAAVVSLLLAPTYEAAALVVVAKPQYELEFDERIRSVEGSVTPPYKAYPTLARSDEVISTLMAEMGDDLADDERTVDAMRKKLAAQNGSDPSLIRLSVQDGAPVRAAEIANLWAQQFVEAANELYTQSSDNLDFFTAQEAEAQAALAEAEHALSEFQGDNRSAILQTQLLTAQTALTTTLESAYAIEMAFDDARVLQDRLHALEPTAAALPGDELAALLIQVTALNRDQSGIQLELSLDPDLGDRTAGDQVAFVDSLVELLESRLAKLHEQAADLEPTILFAQEVYEDARAQQDRLTTARDLAYETYLTLSHKAAEARIEAQDATGDVLLASRATPVYDPVSPRKALNTLVAGAVGLLLGIVAALAIEYWRQGKREALSG
jgi:uncharacterized protein involved in exopolysaccharide biosynthesis